MSNQHWFQKCPNLRVAEGWEAISRSYWMDFGFDGNICSHGLDVKRRHTEDERNRL